MSRPAKPVRYADRVELVSINNDGWIMQHLRPVWPGTRGLVVDIQWVAAHRWNIGVQWDNGCFFTLELPVDKFIILPRKEK